MFPQFLFFKWPDRIVRFPADSLLRIVLTNNQTDISRIAGENDFVVNALRIGQNVMKILSYGNSTAVNPSTMGFNSFKNYKIVTNSNLRTSSTS